MTADNILTVDGLSVSYGKFNAVQNVSFSVRKGEIFGLLGPNGAGKTSTLSAVEGLLKPQAGTIIVDGNDAGSKPLHARASLGVQLQSTSFQNELFVIEVLQLYAGIYGVPASKNDLMATLREINLEDSAMKKFGELSGGQHWYCLMSLPLALIRNRAGSFGNALKLSANGGTPFCLPRTPWKKQNLFATGLPLLIMAG
jgi:ABC-type multidrug transport system ATPase subunit